MASLVELLRGCDAEQVFTLWRSPIVEWIKTIARAEEIGPSRSDPLGHFVTERNLWLSPRMFEQKHSCVLDLLAGDSSLRILSPR